VYRIVFEKVTRAKESMRMMGMGDFAYWFSWFSYYTVVNTILTTLVWICLMINVLNRKSAGFIWLFIWMYG
jgi:cellulose synthase/poly-beta-1,6-N-acetylglucosamine synthase-like glycosyltransferase